ncbi:methylated-DNA--[protein]-cysteine S-methyltransferase [Sporosarcina luteola]|uniref:methylated-DNA--[protein]-cysteine S-methyltransferase n=1 Tax=Sporosarcina luteola TaxID=582850 RepID=UPI00203FE6CC|nr:methylated-DNA--[protein]-cysteine S-methyltransferase [Sporosarcina luteola]MCM3709602.1 methylated-DNA--[protein]-cysteine S-methyltransferase [Sporosarcina luteola]
MDKNSKDIIYWTLFIHGEWNIHLAATTDGLCYAGPNNAPFEELDEWAKKRLPAFRLVEDRSVLEPYADELIAYMDGKRQAFTMPVDLHGTPFQQSVWMALQEIPFGETVSYSDIAERIQKPKSVRAVGAAIGANPLLITVPCHRVIGKNGKLTGFRGGLEMKKQLLELEK